MKILFLTPSLAFGRDALADYSILLAGELRGRGHEPALFGWRSHASVPAEGDLGSIQMLGQASSGSPWRRWAAALEQFQPDWVSTQFVTFGYHPKGLPFEFAQRLPSAVGGRKTHLMLHEIWSGLRMDKRWKESILGVVQRWLILRLVRRLRPAALHTSIEYYRRLLGRSKVDAKVLPIFGNVPVTEANADAWLKPLLPEPCRSASDAILICSFGSIHNPPVWLELLRRVNSTLVRLGRHACVALVGGRGRGPVVAQAAAFDRIHFMELGMRSAAEVDQILNSCHFGLATTPMDALGKSSSAIAMAEHGMPLLVRGGFRISEMELPPPPHMVLVDLDKREFDPSIPRFPRHAILGTAAETMVADLHAADFRA